MSNEIDNKVVSMQFDNKQFESNVQTTLGTLDKLKQSLNLSGAAKGLESVQAAANNCNMSGLSSAVETVRTKFSALQVMGVTALANITNSAMNAGKKLVSAFTIDPIKSGLSEYETQIGAVQTILANTKSKGSTLDDVNGALDELNSYADKTIYNFTEMTRNIGTFTAAGVDLDKSVTSIKGIANLAAVSGSTSQQASTAMYQLSQALAAGKVQLMDWNSVVNAGMGGQVFQDALKRTATNMGTNVDAMIKKYGSFRESLTKGEWLTAEVLTETLTQLSGAYSEADLIAKGYSKEQAKEIVELANTAVSAATEVKTFTQLMDTLKEAAQSGWTQTWEILIGDFEEAKKLWTGVSDVIGNAINDMSESRNKMLQGWKDLGGRTMLVDSVKNAFDGLVSIIKPIAQAFKEVFPPTTSEQLLNLTKGLKDLTEKFKIGKETAEAIKNTFKGFFSIAKLGMTIVVGLVKGVAKLVGALLPAGGGILAVTGSIGEFVTNLSNAISKLNIFDKIFSGLAKVVSAVSNVLGDALKGVSNTIDKWGGLIGILKKVGSAIKWLFDTISDAVSKMLSGGNMEAAFTAINGGLLAGVLVGIKGIIKKIVEAIGEGGGLFDNIKDMLDTVRGSLEAWQQNLKAGTLLKIASAVGILALSLKVLSTIDPDKLGSALGAVTVLFAELLTSMKIFDMMGTKFKGAGKSATIMIGMSVAILILASALKKISDLSWEQLTKGLIGVGILMGELALFMNKAKFGGKTVSTALGLVILAGGIKILASACADFGNMDWKQIGKGLAAIGGLLLELGLFTKLIGNAKNMMSTGVGILMIGTAMKSFASAIGSFGNMSWEGIAKGLVAIAGALAVITAAVNLMPPGMVGMGVGLIAIGTALKIIADAVGSFGNMSWEGIAKGLVAIAGALAAITITVNFMPKNMISIGLGLIAIAAALNIIASAIGSFGNMSWEGIAKGLVAIAGSLTIIAVAMNFMTSALPGAAALLIVAAALAILTPVLTTLGGMSWESIGKGLVALAGAFVVIGVAGAILAPITGVIIALGAGIALLGVGCLAAGAGILAFSAGLAALAVTGTAGIAVIVEGITALLGLVPTIATKIGEAIVAIAVAIGSGSAAILGAVSQILVAILQAIIDVVPKLSECIVTILTALCNIIIEMAPKIVETFMSIIMAILNGLVEYVPKFVDAGMKILIGFLQGIANNIGKVVSTAVDIVVNFLEAIGKETPRIVDAGFKMIIDFINGIADSIRTNTPLLVSAMQNLLDAMVEAAIMILTGSVSGFLSSGKKLITGLIDGLKQNFSKVYTSVKEVVSTAASKIKEKASSFLTAGKDMIQGFINGIKSKISAAANAAKDVGSKALNSIKNFLGINSPAKKAIPLGEGVDEGLIVGLKALASNVSKTAKNVGSGAITSMKKTMSKVGDIVNTDINSQPTIRPVVDLSDVRAGANSISDLFGMQPSVGIMSNVGAISAMMNGGQNGNDDVVSAIKDLGRKLGNIKGDTYSVGDVTYDDGSNITNAVQSIVRAARIERRS